MFTASFRLPRLGKLRFSLSRPYLPLNFRKEVIKDDKSLLNVSKDNVLLSTSFFPDTTTPSSELESTVNSTLLKWLVAAGLCVGIYMYTDISSIFKKLSCQASCKNIDALSTRYPYFIADVVERASRYVVYIEASVNIDSESGSFDSVVGSGFVVGNGEYVLTNAHVVHGAENLKIKLSSGKVVQGEVTDIDEEVDLALVKLYLPSYVSITPAAFGDSSRIRPGECVIAMGSPFTLSNTITFGVVSTVDQPGKDFGMNEDMEYIQTDAVIAEGSSGGPLINLDGEVIGINVIAEYPGISFAIPIHEAEVFLQYADKAPKRQKSTRYQIGMSLIMLGPRLMGGLQNHFFIPPHKGILIISVVKGRPAEAVGLRKGDIIVKVNDKNVTSLKDLTSAIAKGKRFSIELYRQDRTIKRYITPKQS